MIVSDESLAGLDAGDQDALKAAAVAFEARRWTVVQQDRGKSERRLADEPGANVVEPGDDQIAAMAAMAAMVRAEVWPVALEDVGVEWGHGVLDQIGN